MTDKKSARVEKRFARFDIEDSIGRCVKKIENADLVAFDLEFSGLVTDTGNKLNHKANLADYYAHSKDSVNKFATLQLGVCCANYNKSEDKWILSPFAFYTRPQDRIFSSDTESLKFLAGQNFDLSKWALEALPYTRLAFPHVEASGGTLKSAKSDDVKSDAVKSDASKFSEPKPCKKTELRALLAACARTKVPMVFHHGWFDALHLWHCFVDDLPDDIVVFGRAWKTLFGPICDTKYIADQHRWSIFSRVNATTLAGPNGALLAESNEFLPTFVIREDVSDYLSAASSTEQNGASKAISQRAEHDAGADALLCAKVFLAQRNMIKGAPKTKKRKKSANGTAVSNENTTISSGSLLAPIVDKGSDLQNVISVCGAPPGSFRF